MNILIVRKSRNGLQFTQEYGIVPVYLIHGKGGYDACDVRVPNSRGGSEQTEGINGYCTEAYQAQATCSLQDQWCLPHHNRRSTKVSGYPTNGTIRGKLNHRLNLSAAPQPPVVSQAPSDCVCQHYLVTYCSIGNGWLERACLV